ncbi:hypothetical protein BURCENBC7_AP5169 [Burkholderia cenocepacia BC7]|nr:hypothetical protein BURCENK562V_C4181 [Burkholderia cenocepacia K56-2Valvano]ERI26105.1 hypothetical protein BURCENBC7_AP5169 [Burkholderia cenocepacia BC7]
MAALPSAYGPFFIRNACRPTHRIRYGPLRDHPHAALDVHFFPDGADIHW